jgi:CBS domain-containing protein
MLIKNVMTKSPLCCTPEETLDRVAKLMAEHDCGVVPIVGADGLVGVITDRDVACRAVATGKAPASTAVSEVMTKTVYTVRPEESVQAAIDLMKTKQVRRLPVVDDRGKVIGIVAPSDLAPIFASMNVADFLLAVSYWSRPKGVAAA